MVSVLDAHPHDGCARVLDLARSQIGKEVGGFVLEDVLWILWRMIKADPVGALAFCVGAAFWLWPGGD